MTSHADDPFAEALTHVDQLPLTWRPLAQWPAAPELEQANRNAIALLGLLGSLDESPPPLEDAQLAVYLQRLDQKLDLALELLGGLLAREQVLPTPVPVRVSARGVAWKAAPAPAAGPGWLTLYLLPQLPKALNLPAHLRPLSATGEVAAEFQGLDPALTDALARFVFRRHRRAVALNRRSPAAE
ncbi:MAG: hypothetical protein Kow0073_15020 [Immundisolibacter sp.]